ncbi:hypothetical protein [Desulfobulbus alkaliphilus]|uniref:hypothetical protein n=1 Tax=Desulfobulbus alkaliphilus TaxID=869814 RepID=UPI001964D6F6|nr:hypothetical protein [Desulfobulbus alkaliphilus]MBM9538390.1 hypothetical protein [Desulfobulbus alkaliphilus]
MRSLLLTCFLALFLVAGCYTKPVRHLASDAALIKPGQSTAADVHKYLGEPDGRREVGPGLVEYVYFEDRPGFLGGMPMVGRLSSSSGYEMIIITLEHDLVRHAEFRTFSKDDHRWMKNYSWEPVQ